ncbi:MAG TPA: hypothetical protein VKT77_11175 [Chthonomonadaceae bacterium]|nr:hypothetical protein [Chthonomonadaceae bacterium]
MPLSAKARLEIYLPDLPSLLCQELLEAFRGEFTYTFGGCTVVSGLHGSYQSRLGIPIEDRVNLIFTDTPFVFDTEIEKISRYADALREIAFAALDEEAILVVAFKVYHSGYSRRQLSTTSQRES